MRWIKNLFFGLSILSIFSFFFYGFFVLMFKLFNKSKGLGIGRVSLWFGSISFIIMAVSFLFSMESNKDIAEPNIFSVMTFVSSIIFLITSLFGFISSFKQTKHSTISRCYFRFSALLMVGIAIFLLTQGIVGIRLWSY